MARCLDFIGDVHGCYEELLDLLQLLGYKLHLRTQGVALPVLDSIELPPGRQLVFVGDLVDRGPRSALVLNLAMQLEAQAAAAAVCGNHDHKLLRYFDNSPVNVGRARRLTIEAILCHGESFCRSVHAFLKNRPAIIEDEELIVLHAAYREGLTPEASAMLAIYGESDDANDGNSGHNCEWEQAYKGTKTIVRGHDVVEGPAFVSNDAGGMIIDIDTGCVFGGRLTALRYPEQQVVSVPARAVHWKRKK